MTSFLKNGRFLENPRNFLKIGDFPENPSCKIWPGLTKIVGGKNVLFFKIFLKKKSKIHDVESASGCSKKPSFLAFHGTGPCDLIFGHFYPSFLTKNGLHFFLEIDGFLKNGRFRKTPENFKKNRGLSRPTVYAFYARLKLSANTKSDVKKH